MVRRSAARSAPPRCRRCGRGWTPPADGLWTQKGTPERTSSPPAGDAEGGRDHDYVFILTYGRSGSTLLQGILNASPGVVIRGENKQVIRHLFEYHSTLCAESQRTGTEHPTSAWFGIGGFDPQASLSGIRRLVDDTLLRVPPGTRLAGFKEVRWTGDGLEHLVQFVRDVFPGARFILNTRDLDAVARSGWWATNPLVRPKLVGLDARLRAVAQSLGDSAFHVHCDDYVADPARLEPLFAWLGLPFDETQVRAVLAQRHSS